MTTEQPAQEKVLHPTSFMVIGVPLSTESQPAQIPPDAMEFGALGFEVNPEKLRKARVGIRAMLVTEVGPLPEDHSREIHAPFDRGCIAYYPEGSDVQVANYVVLHVERVIAYSDPD